MCTNSNNNNKETGARDTLSSPTVIKVCWRALIISFVACAPREGDLSGGIGLSTGMG